MTHHLSPEDIIRMADDEIANGERSAARQHVSACDQCRREVEFQKTLRRTLGQALPTPVKKSFTSSVLGAIGVPARKGLSDRISDNLGSLFALLMVIGMFGIVSTYVSSLEQPAATTSPGLWSELSQKAGNISAQFRHLLPSFTRTVRPSAPADPWNVWMPVALALVILLGLDTLLGRFYRFQSRRKR
jgi:anti-sigma factor RsiW